CARRSPTSSTHLPYTTLFRSGTSINRRWCCSSGITFLTRNDGANGDAQPVTTARLAASIDEGVAALGQDLPTGAAERLARLLVRSEEHTSELQSRENLVCRLL